MKKTQVALAALALVASTAALADGVTIYGTLDAAVARTTGHSTYFSGAGAMVAGNNIGFKGSEDLGNGMKASFNLEAGIDLNGNSNNGGGATACAAANPGACNGSIFSRLANVNLSGEFGGITAGMQLSPMVAAYAGTGTLGNGHFFVNYIANAGGAAVNTAGATSGTYYEGFFIPNAVTYTSPSMGGFTLNAMTQTKTGNGRGTVADGVDTDSYQAYSLTGAIGQINIAAAYDTRKTLYSTSMIAANTSFGPLKVAGSVYSTKTDGADRVGSYSVEGGYALSDALNVGLQYGKIDATNEQTLTSVFAKYALSKRTGLYATYITGKNISSSFDTRGQAYSGNNNTTAVGVTHSF
jgi:predicted porin